MVRRKSPHRALSVVLALVLALTASPLARAGHLAQLKDKGTLTLLCFPTTRTIHAFVDMDRLMKAKKPVSEIHDPDFFAGIEVDLVKRFAQEQGLQLEVQAITTSYADLIQALLDGKGDLIASSLTITEKRDEFMDFTIPISFGSMSVVVPEDSPVKSWADLKGLKGAVMKGSSQLEYIKTLGLEGIELTYTSFTIENLAEVEEGRADFTVIDTTVGVGEPPDPASPHLKVAFHLRQFGNGMALPEGSDLRPVLNEFLQRMMDSGEVDRLHEKYTLEKALKTGS